MLEAANTIIILRDSPFKTGEKLSSYNLGWVEPFAVSLLLTTVLSPSESIFCFRNINDLKSVASLGTEWTYLTTSLIIIEDISFSQALVAISPNNSRPFL